MVTVGMLGAVSVGKTAILRMFVYYLKQNLIEGVEGGAKAKIIRAHREYHISSVPVNESKTSVVNR